MQRRARAGDERVADDRGVGVPANAVAPPCAAQSAIAIGPAAPASARPGALRSRPAAIR